jgi:hypothetical protein
LSEVAELAHVLRNQVVEGDPLLLAVAFHGFTDFGYHGIASRGIGLAEFLHAPFVAHTVELRLVRAGNQRRILASQRNSQMLYDLLHDLGVGIGIIALYIRNIISHFLVLPVYLWKKFNGAVDLRKVIGAASLAVLRATYPAAMHVVFAQE